MARRRSRQKTSSQCDSGPVVHSFDGVPATTDPGVRKNSSAAAPVAMVRRSTCILCMLASLMLGVYAGILAPRFSDAVTPISVVQKDQTDLPRIPDMPPMPSEMAQEIVRLEKIVQASPDDAHAWAHLGNLYFDTGQAKQAITAYERSLAVQPDNADVLTDLGIMYRETGGYTKAVECFRKASTLRPGHENALFNEGVVLYYDLHDKKEALTAWQKLLQVNPQARTPDGKSVAEMLKTLP